MKPCRTTKPKSAQWVREASAILDAMERNPPSEKSLAPFKTRNWIRKGEGMLAGLKPKKESQP